MAGTSIDRLQIEISANADAARKSLEGLANALLKLQNTLPKIKFGNISGSLKQLNNAVKSLDTGKIVRYSEALKGLSTSIAIFSSASKKVEATSESLEKLSKLDFSKLQINGDFSGFSALAQGMNAFAEAATKLAAVKPTEINRAVKGLEKLQGINLSGVAQSVQSLSGVDFSTLNNLGTAFQGFSASLAGADKISAGTAKIFHSLAQLTSSAANIPIVQQSLPALSSEIQRFITAMAQAPTVQGGTTAIVSALSGIASSGGKIQKVVSGLPGLTNSVRDFVTSLSTLPRLNNSTLRAVEALARIAPAGARAGSAARRLQENITGLTNSMNGLRGSATSAVSGIKSFMRSILSALGIAGGIYAVINGIKSAITYSSDLAEAQNVVNQGFGNLSYMADNFAQSAVHTFGMSELAVKKTAGQFAAMGKSLGLSQKQAADMAISLTGLTGDLASFWNVSQDVAQTALTSVFTGETESLKKFSVVMTESNLQAFAYSQGINKAVSAMNQAEKTQLRYAYVLEKTAIAQGDFASTSGSWSNQLRILSGQFQTLAGIIGNGLVAAFLPVVKVLNLVLSKIIQFANTIASFAGKLFGIKPQTASVGAGLSEIASSAGNVEDNMESAAGGIEDVGSAAKKSEKKLNGFISGWHEVNNMTSNKNPEDNGGSSGIAIPDMNLPSKYEMNIAADDKASPVIDSIKKRLMELAALFMDGFRFGLGDTSVFESIQANLQSIKKSLKDIFTNSEVIAAFNNMLDVLAYNAGAKAGSFVSIGATIIDNITGGAALYLDSAKEHIQNWLIDMFDITAKADTIVTNFHVALADVFTVFRSDEAKQITADIIQIFTDGFMGATKIAAKLGTDILDTILTPITENAEKIKQALSNTLRPVSETLTTLADSFTKTWDKINQMYDEHISPLFSSIRDGLTEIVETLLDGYNTYLAPTLDSLANKFSEVWDGHVQPLLDNFIDLFGEVATLVQNVWETVFQPLLNWVADKIFPVVSPIIKGLGTLVLSVFSGISDTLNGFITIAKGVIQFVSGVFSGDWKKAWEGVQNVFKGIWDAIPGFIKGPIRAIIGFINKMIGGIESGVNSAIKAVNKLSFDVPDWVPGVGGETFGFNLNTVSLPRVPQLASGGVVRSATLALIGENGAEAVMPLENNTGWISNLARNITDEMGNIRLNVMPDISRYQYRPVSGEISDSMSLAMDEMSYYVNRFGSALQRQNELLEDIITAVNNKELAIGDDEIFHSWTKAQRKHWKTTNKTGVLGID